MARRCIGNAIVWAAPGRHILAALLGCAVLAAPVLAARVPAGAVTAAQTGAAGPQWAWQLLHPPESPTPRADAPMAYDAETHQLLLFGGEGNFKLRCSGLFCSGTTVVGEANDTWSWEGRSWVQLQANSPYGSASQPGDRMDASMAYDARSRQLLLFGGFGPMPPQGGTWAWDGKVWLQLHPAASPPDLMGASMAYDPRTGQLLLFGGQLDNVASGKTWVWTGTDWSQLHPVRSPSARCDAPMAYDARTGQLVLFGGSNNNRNWSGSDETWTWDGKDWAELSAGETSTNAPLVSVGLSTMAYDPSGGKLLLVSEEPITNSLSPPDGLYAWDGTTWSAVAGSSRLPSLILPSMVYDPVTTQLLLFGGALPGRYFGETWSYRQ